MKAPFRYFGGKSKVASLVWSRLDHNTHHYFEPFAGSLAVLLGRPQASRKSTVETVNDMDGMVVNFFRSVKHDPDTLVKYAYDPVSSVDMWARMLECKNANADIVGRMIADPEFCDPKLAGYWCYAVSTCIMGAYANMGCWHRDGLKGIERRTASGTGISMSKIGANGHVNSKYDWRKLYQRLQSVRIQCGDWRKCIMPSVVEGSDSAIFLDPPYTIEGRAKTYANDSKDIAAQVLRWSIEASEKYPKLRIAYCGYDDMPFPKDWECIAWKSGGANRGKAHASNTKRERIYFSPSCMTHRFK